MFIYYIKSTAIYKCVVITYLYLQCIGRKLKNCRLISRRRCERLFPFNAFMPARSMWWCSLNPYVCPKVGRPRKPNPVFLLHLRDLRGAIIVAGRKNFATEVKQSLEPEIKKEGPGRGAGKERNGGTQKPGLCPGFDRNKGDRLSLRDSVRFCGAALLCSPVWTRLIINTRIRFWKTRPGWWVGVGAKGTFLNYGIG